MTKTTTQTAGRLTEADLLARYSHIVKGTLTMDRNHNKQKVKIFCYGTDGKRTGKTRWIFTSDLHQCAWVNKDEVAPVTRKQILAAVRA